MSTLDIFRNTLGNLYLDHLKLKLLSEWEPEACVPAWITVSGNDYLKQIFSQDDRKVALFLDPKLGKVMVVRLYEGGDLNDTVQKAIRVATKLQPVYQSSQPAHEIIPWHVEVLWLVQKEKKDEWKKAITIRRQESVFSEEIGLDAVFYGNEASLPNEIYGHGLPSLLIRTRAMLCTGKENISRWTSANEDVLDALKAFPDSFDDTEMKAFASDVVMAASSMQDAGSENTLPDKAHHLRQLEVSHFRNMDECVLNFDGRISGQGKKSHVIFGPNGTGKSSLFEAISLAVCGASTRLEDWVSREEREVLPTQKSAYLENVIAPIDGEAPIVSYAVNGECTEYCKSSSEAEERLKEIEGILLSQEDSRKFIEASGFDLAEKILRGYSTVAESARAYAENKYDISKKEKDTFLQGLGLNTGIKKITTAHEKMAERVFNEFFPKISGIITQWLMIAEKAGVNGAKPLRELMRHWEEESKKGLYIAFFQINDSQEASRSNIEPWILHYNKHVQQTSNLMHRVRSESQPLRDQWDVIRKDIELWAEWLKKTVSQPEGLPEQATPEVEKLQELYTDLSKEVQTITIQGKEVGARIDHFRSMQSFLNSWSEKHPNECPTCSADHQDHGGIVEVVRMQEIKASNEQQDLRTIWKEKSDKMKSIEARLTAISSSQCPVSKARQAELDNLLGSYLEGRSTEEVIRLNQEREILNLIRRVINVPEQLPEAVEGDSLLSLLTENIASLEVNRAQVWEAPEKWDQVRNELVAMASDIVRKHMPNTLQAVWLEIAMAITSAPWNTKMPKFKTELKRGSEKVSVVVKGDREILGRYFYNQAESHILGLAWFFTQYLAKGRFRFEWQVMDDPAQEMDQTTFRSFCRFLQSWLRMNTGSKESSHYKFVCLLHQEERALDLARSLWGEIHLLKWTKENNGQLSILKLFGDEFAPGVPTITSERQ